MLPTVVRKLISVQCILLAFINFVSKTDTWELQLVWQIVPILKCPKLSLCSTLCNFLSPESISSGLWQWTRLHFELWSSDCKVQVVSLNIVTFRSVPTPLLILHNSQSTYPIIIWEAISQGGIAVHIIQCLNPDVAHRFKLQMLVTQES